MAKYALGSAAARKAQNKGVAHGTVRKGRGGRTQRRYNANTGRWDVIKNVRPSVAGARSKVIGSGSDGVNAASSAGSARTSTGSTRVPQGTPGAVSGRFPSQYNARQRRAASRRQQTVKSGVTSIAGGGPAVAAARYGVTQVTKRLPKVRADKALDFGSRAARTGGKALSRWWSGY